MKSLGNLREVGPTTDRKAKGGVGQPRRAQDLWRGSHPWEKITDVLHGRCRRRQTIRAKQLKSSTFAFDVQKFAGLLPLMLRRARTTPGEVGSKAAMLHEPSHFPP